MSPGKKSGFTLVELLLAMSLMVLVGGVMYLLQSTGLSTVKKGMTRLTLQSEVRRKLERLVADLRCANEILEVRGDMIKFTRFVVTETGEVGDAALVPVTYELRKGETGVSLSRQEKGAEPLEVLSFDHIEGEIFNPYYEDYSADPTIPPTYQAFDMKTNDSGKRKRITFLRLKLRVRQNKEFISIDTSVAMRTAHSRLSQPNWKFR